MQENKVVFNADNINLSTARDLKINVQKHTTASKEAGRKLGKMPFVFFDETLHTCSGNVLDPTLSFNDHVDGAARTISIMYRVIVPLST